MEAKFVSPKDYSALLRDGNCLRSERGDVFPIINDIARFASSDYAASFGDQWNRFAKTQLDSVTGRGISESRLQRVFCGSFDAFAGGRVLEVGAGAGRFTEILARHVRELYVTDLSHAIDANRSNNARFDNISFAQASVYQLPFPDEWFDAAVLLGVIQHTPDPLSTLRSVTRTVKKGGHVAVDFYRRRLSFLTRAGLILTRRLIRGYDSERAGQAVEQIYRFFEPIHRRLARNLASYVLLTRISPITTYYHRKDLSLGEDQLREWGHLDTHDQLTDSYKFLFSAAKVKKMCASCGLEIIRLKRGGNGLELLARRQ